MPIRLLPLTTIRLALLLSRRPLSLDSSASQPMNLEKFIALPPLSLDDISLFL